MSAIHERNSLNIDWSQKIQLSGTLFKKPFGGQSNKWAKRFFVIRDGYLLYYPESEKKELEKKGSFNIHPKGILPLGDCTVTPCREHGQPNAFYVDSSDIHGRLLLAADSGFERDKWIDMLERSKRITWKNAELADSMIRQLEEQALQMAKQRQEYFDQLQSEVLALSDERERSEELERVNQELAKEKQKIEQYHQEVMEEYDRIKSELEDTAEFMQTLETDRIELSETLQVHQAKLQSLHEEKEKVLDTLQSYETDKVKLEEENQSLQETKGELQSTLKLIEMQTKQLQQGKVEAEERIKENEERAKMLEQEKVIILDHAEELKETIKDLKVQKERTETELKEEVVARLDAEKKLRDAGISLNKIDCAVKDQTPNIEQEVKEEMVVNVNKLKKFFEDLNAEVKMDSEKPSIMKNSIHARKTIARRAKTKKFQRSKSSSLRLKSSGAVSLRHEDEDKKMAAVRRAATTARKGYSVTLPLQNSNTLAFEEHL